ncbi:hypothetical protein LSTR_LSTR013135 [Laodelphax striatellus]|uniref:Uncharacterized protein n=1 Tax=Laodelphax striatellus TaxID=195883 RepID=A0A482XEU1_LAOST|nr:hypothetical protein LSTR_LSTR013135 [Laodelphax striatellus]
MNSCMASLLPACDPPLMTLKAGTGRIILLLPARLSRPAATTLRPRSGKEYQKIDRCSVGILQVTETTAAKKPAFGPITTVPEKTENLPPDCSK